MSSDYPNQPPYPGVAFPPIQPPEPLPDKPGRPWPLGAVNRWLTIGAAVITVLAVLLAVLASQTVSKPPSTAGMKLVYQSDLTQNSSGQLHWDENDNCQFSSSGYVVTAPDSNNSTECVLQGSGYQDFILKVSVVNVTGVALIGFYGDDWLEIFDSGRFFFSHPQDSQSTTPTSQASAGIGSAALHPSALGISERSNDIIIQVQGLTYSFYANGQLLTTYTTPDSEAPEPIALGVANGQALFGNMAIYTPD